MTKFETAGWYAVYIMLTGAAVVMNFTGHVPL